jgi:hypothetical protein
MGVESYKVRLGPEAGGDPLMVETVTRTLTTSGFRRLGLRTEFGPAHLSSPPENQAEYERRDAEAVLEAILYFESFPGERTSADRLVVTGIDIRFAICQPAPAETLFRRAVEKMVREHNLLIRDGYRNRQYRPEEMASYLDDLTRIVAGLRENWRRLFGTGYEERVLASAEAWGYYLDRKRSGTDKAK